MKKILVAEDEQNIREFVVINLKRAGYDCVEAASGEEALRVYEQAGGDFDVAVLDIMMPGSLDGLAVCKELRHHGTCCCLYQTQLYRRHLPESGISLHLLILLLHPQLLLWSPLSLFPLCHLFSP